MPQVPGTRELTSYSRLLRSSASGLLSAECGINARYGYFGFRCPMRYTIVALQRPAATALQSERGTALPQANDWWLQ